MALNSLVMPSSRQNLRVSLKLLIALALVICRITHAQDDNPVSVDLEIYVVSEVTGSSGALEERFSEASTARPGQTVEYRLIVQNIDDTTLPAGTVVVTGPIPAETTFLANSATPSSGRVLTEFSVDTTSFSEPPVLMVGADGSQVVAEPSDYNVVRWTLLEPFEPGAQDTLVYRVTVD